MNLIFVTPSTGNIDPAWRTRVSPEARAHITPLLNNAIFDLDPVFRVEKTEDFELKTAVFTIYCRADNCPLSNLIICWDAKKCIDAWRLCVTPYLQKNDKIIQIDTPFIAAMPQTSAFRHPSYIPWLYDLESCIADAFLAKINI